MVHFFDGECTAGSWLVDDLLVGGYDDVVVNHG